MLQGKGMGRRVTEHVRQVHLVQFGQNRHYRDKFDRHSGLNRENFSKLLENLEQNAFRRDRASDTNRYHANSLSHAKGRIVQYICARY